MAVRVALNHKTEYRYDRRVRLSPHVIRLRPAPHTRTPILAYSLRVTPEKHFINWQQDPFGNYLARLVFLEPTRVLSIEVDVVANMTVINPFDFFLEEYAEHVPFEYAPELRRDLAPYLKVREDGHRLRDWIAGIDRSRRMTNDFLVALNRRLCGDIRYTVRMEAGIQSCEDTLGKALGSCRDSGWLLVQVLRHLGLAARFVSGYLVQLMPDIKPLDGPSGPERDFTDLHAWAEVYLPGAGWVGLDPTSGLFAGEGHIPLACTPDAQSAAPVTGSTDECQVEFGHSNAVTRLHEDPRVTKPYSDAAWAAIDALGRAIDADLARDDVRLTLGGEPTFVSIDDMEGAEWNLTALGAHKRRLAEDLIKRLRRRFAPGGVALWPRQVVSGGVPAALGARLFLAQGRRPRVAQRRSHRRSSSERRPSYDDNGPDPGGALRCRPGAAPRRRRALRHPGLRGRLVLPLEGRQCADQPGPAHGRAEAPGGA
jgi:transglutaminase-like putative cysteine protease